MGKVMVKIKLTNNTDAQLAESGRLPVEQVRSTEIEALVDTGATNLILPADVVARLGLPEAGRRNVRYADGRVAEVGRVMGVRIEILGRDMTCDALVQAAGTPALVGQIPLEGLDLVVDPKNQTVSVNPASPDAPLLDILGAA